MHGERLLLTRHDIVRTLLSEHPRIRCAKLIASYSSKLVRVFRLSYVIAPAWDGVGHPINKPITEGVRYGSASVNLELPSLQLEVDYILVTRVHFAEVPQSLSGSVKSCTAH